MRRTRLFVVVMAILGMLAAACGKSTTTSSPSGSGSASGGVSVTPASSLTGAGSTFAQPLYNKWATDFQASNHIQVSYQGVGSSAGIGFIVNKQVDFGATDAPYKATSTAVAKIINIPTALGAVVVTYNLPGVSKPIQLSGQTLADIFQTTITKWNDPAIAKENPGVTLPSTNITVVHRSDGSGTTYIFTSYLSAVSDKWKSALGVGTTVNWSTKTLGGAKSTGVTQAVKGTPGAIGYVELTYAIQNNSPAAAIQNADKTAYVAPTVSTTAAAASHFDVSTLASDDLVFNLINEPGNDSYPIAGPTYALAYQVQSDGPKGKALVDFLHWGLTTGQAAEGPLDYVALPDPLAQKATAAVDGITYNGKSLRTGQ